MVYCTKCGMENETSQFIVLNVVKSYKMIVKLSRK